MNWRTKARIQNLIAMLPEQLTSICYYRMQRHFGALRSPSPDKKIIACGRLAGAIQARRPLAGMRMLEVGTGRTLAIPVGMWLLGAAQVLTVDINLYLRAEIVRSDLAYFRANRPWLTGQLETLVSDREALHGRLDRLLALDLQLPARQLLDEVMQLGNIRYEAPADAGRLNLEAGSVDVHFSRYVLEHIPPEDLRKLLAAGARALGPEGLCVHLIDLGDHFQHGDPSISRVNFLRFSETGWDRLAGNRFMYMNRLRASDYLSIFADSGLTLLDIHRTVDEESLALIESGGLPLDGRFQDKTAEDLATTELLVVARPKQVPA